MAERAALPHPRSHPRRRRGRLRGRGGHLKWPRRRQERRGVLADPVVGIHACRHTRRRHGEHRHAAPYKDLGRTLEVVPTFHREEPVQVHGHQHLYRQRCRAREELADRRGALVGEQHRSLRRHAQQGQAHLVPVRRSIDDRRPDLRGDARCADRCPHPDHLVSLRQPDPHLRRVLQGVLATQAQRLSPRRRAQRALHEQGEDRRVDRGLRRGFGLRAGARQRHVPARRLCELHLARAGDAGAAPRALGERLPDLSEDPRRGPGAVRRRLHGDHAAPRVEGALASEALRFRRAGPGFAHLCAAAQRRQAAEG